MTIVPIDLPAVLQAHREHLRGKEELADPANEIELLQQALSQACEYGQTLWQQLDSQRHYLLGCLPPARGSEDEQSEHVGAAPSGPDDEQGWRRWMDAYAEATSILAGPHGDSGYGRTEAETQAQARRG